MLWPTSRKTRWDRSPVDKKVFSCDETTDPTRVGGMLGDTSTSGGARSWYYEAPKLSVYVGGDIILNACADKAFDDNLAYRVCHDAGPGVCEKLRYINPDAVCPHALAGQTTCRRAVAVCQREMVNDKPNHQAAMDEFAREAKLVADSQQPRDQCTGCVGGRRRCRERPVLGHQQSGTHVYGPNERFDYAMRGRRSMPNRGDLPTPRPDVGSSRSCGDTNKMTSRRETLNKTSIVVRMCSSYLASRSGCPVANSQLVV
jgi:hypothetical protein